MSVIASELNALNATYRDLDKKTQVYAYFKDTKISTTNANHNAMQSLWTFQDKLMELKHFHSEYHEIEHLKRQFNDELQMLLNAGLI